MKKKTNFAVDPSEIKPQSPDLEDAIRYGKLSSHDAEIEAQENGWFVVFPAPDELQIDIDSAESLARFEKLISIAQQYFVLLEVSRGPSISGLPDHYHITLRTDRDLDNRTRIALQAILGSDPIRELRSLVRDYVSDPHPTLFFERKDESK
jgi:hypothetical protein